MLVKNKSFVQLQELLLGKRAKFICDCEFFTRNGVVGKIVKMEIQSGETIFDVLCDNQKHIKIGSNMPNLSVTIL